MPRGGKRTASKTETKNNAGGTSKLRRKGAVEEVSCPKKLGQVLTCGTGDVGQLGLGESSMEKTRFTIVSALGGNIVDICAGGMHTVCIDNNGDVWTFGCNDEGALGRDTSGELNEWTPSKITLPDKAIKVSAGDSHTAALLQSGQVYAWGSFRDSHGSMGLTMKGNEPTPIEMLPGQKVIQIASGGDHLVMLTDQGQVYTCGCAEQGQLGRVTARSCDRHSRLGLNPLLIPAPLHFRPRDKTDFDMIWAGIHNTFARETGKGTIFVWGLNNYQQLGVRKGKPESVFTPTISEAFAALKSVKWAKICGGPHHTLALDTDGICYALGRKDYGRLGLGENCEDALELTPIPSLEDKKVVQIACGISASYAVTDTGDVYSWGMGTSGLLGTGSENDEHVPQLLRSKQIDGRFGLNISGGGQHAVLLVASIEQPEDKIKEAEKETASSQSVTIVNESESAENKDSAETDSKKTEKIDTSQKKEAEKMDVDAEQANVEEEVAPKRGGRRGRKGSVSSTASTESSRSTKTNKNKKQNGALSTVEEGKDDKLTDEKMEQTPDNKEEAPVTDGTLLSESEEKPSLKTKRAESEDEEVASKRLKTDGDESAVADSADQSQGENKDINNSEKADERIMDVEIANDKPTNEKEILANGDKNPVDEQLKDASVTEEEKKIDEPVEPKRITEITTEKTEEVTKMETETS